MVTADGRVKIADFGIAKATTKMQTGAFLTATGTTVGTPTYMAPEQAMAQDIGPWTDLYSVGCMAFELFTGNVPFHDSDAPMAILLRHVNEPIPPRQVDPARRSTSASRTGSSALLVKEPDAAHAERATTRGTSSRRSCIDLLGPRWRREARLRRGLGPVRHADAADAGAVPGHDVRRRGLRRVQVLRLGQRRSRPTRRRAARRTRRRRRSRRRVPPEPVVGPPTPMPVPPSPSDGSAPRRRRRRRRLRDLRRARRRARGARGRGRRRRAEAAATRARRGRAADRRAGARSPRRAAAERGRGRRARARAARGRAGRELRDLHRAGAAAPADGRRAAADAAADRRSRAPAPVPEPEPPPAPAAAPRRRRPRRPRRRSPPRGRPRRDGHAVVGHAAEAGRGASPRPSSASPSRRPTSRRSASPARAR